MDGNIAHDSIPRLHGGKRSQDGQSTKMPFGGQAHHVVMDDIHPENFYTEMQMYLY
jgi:chloramphenicol O-acetyltransferase